ATTTAKTATATKAPTTTTTSKPTTTTPAAISTTTTPNLTAQTTKRVSTPRGSEALAEFAAKSELPIPSAPRIPVAVTPVTSVKPIQVEPPITAAERQQIQKVVSAEEINKTVDELLQPVATAAEQAQVIEELKALAPAGTEIVDPYDGKIKL